MSLSVGKELALTADKVALSESLGDLRVDLEREILLSLDLLVALLNLRANVADKVGADHGAQDGADEALGQLGDLLPIWEVLEHLWVALRVLIYRLKVKADVLGHVDMLNLVALEVYVKDTVRGASTYTSSCR